MITTDELIECLLFNEIAKANPAPDYYKKFPKGFIPGTRVRVTCELTQLHNVESVVIDHFELKKGDLERKSLDANELERIRNIWERNNYVYIKIPDHLSKDLIRMTYYPYWLISIEDLERC